MAAQQATSNVGDQIYIPQQSCGITKKIDNSGDLATAENNPLSSASPTLQDDKLKAAETGR